MTTAGMSDDAIEFTVLYRARLHPGREADYIAGWTATTDALRTHGGSLGSRLHRGSDGLWYAYARWPSEAARQAAFAMGLAPEARRQMGDAIAQTFPEVILHVESDLWRS